MSFGGTPETNLLGKIPNDDAFYPDLDKGIFQKDYRLPGEYTDSMISEALAFAKDEINDDLAKTRTKWEMSGQTTLTDKQQRFYFKAVYCRAKSYLLANFATVTAKPSANNVGKESPERYDRFLRFSSNAVRSLQSRGRITVRLIWKS